MEQLSTKEKAQRYDEALDNAKVVHKTIRKDLKSVIEQIFPELYEPEDEKIRKLLIRLFSSNNPNEKFDNISTQDIIAWLERQGEQKPFDYENANIQQKDFAPKVEPKFKVGDWIVFNGLTLYINDVVKGYYRTISIDGTPNSYDWDIDNAARLWTIKDATDGDVLCLGGVIAIFKKYIGQENCICYCSFCDNCYCSSCDKGGFEIPIENGEDNVYGCTDTTPANKEQRDLLFAKMHEAGYEWDKDKKELIKQMTDDEHKQYMLEHQNETIYDMSFEEAQDYISKRGFDIPWNDGDVMVDERCITQTVANVLKWADRHPLILLDNKQEEYASGLIYHPNSR